MLQNNLGNALQYASSCHSVENNLRALVAYDEALKVRTSRDMPLQYANTISNKANALRNLPDDASRPEKGHRGNLRHALQYLKEAKEIFERFEDSAHGPWGHEDCPEIVTIKKVKESPPASNGNGTSVIVISPFSPNSDRGWQATIELDDIPDKGIKVLELNGQSLVFSRHDHRVTCFQNACAHMGMPLDMGAVADGVITCPYHGFRYDLSSGECLTAPRCSSFLRRSALWDQGLK